MRAAPAGGYRFALDHGAGTTPIFVASGLLASPPAELVALVAGRRVFVIAAAAVTELHPEALGPLLTAAAEVELVARADGETAKTLAVAEELWNRLLAAGGKRDSVVIAWGGGTIGDLAGFVAATFLRGVDLIQIPTTLLAQVDAAIGGKTGINLPGAKNSVGAFHHPLGVAADTRFLSTLPAAELRSGLVEAIKTAALLDLALLEQIEDELDQLLAADPGRLAPVVAAAAAVKAELVARDPRERGPRQLLNFGHTLGHAIEAACGYRVLRHGEAVAWGMRFALRLASRRGLPGPDRARLEKLLARLALPSLPPLDPVAVLDHLRRDKKAREGSQAWVLPRRLGRGEVVADVPQEVVVAELEAFLGDRP